MTAPPRLGTALPQRLRWRAVLASVLLIGVFVIHGLPVLMALACPPNDAAKSAHQVVRVAVAQTAAAEGSRTSAASRTAMLKAAGCSGCDCSAVTDDSCVPLRLSTSNELRAALLLGLAAVLIPWAGIAAFVGARMGRGGGAARTGPSLLLKVCVCRT